MKILIAGGTGFIGTALTNKLITDNHHVFIATRNKYRYKNSKQVTYIQYDTTTEQLPKIDAVINLAGESLFGRWTNSKKKRILSSRLRSTNKIIELMKQMPEKPNVFINASAVGFYGMNDHTIFTENTTVAGNDFLASITHKWEQAAKASESLGIRTVFARFGIVLAREAGALSLMKYPFQTFIGGRIGNGKQWMSWIHLDDCIKMLLFAIKNDRINGPMNVTSPYPKNNAHFTNTLGTILKRPTLFTVPEPIAKFILGDMSTLITKGQYVYPDKVLQHDFTFTYPHLYHALNNIFNNKD